MYVCFNKGDIRQGLKYCIEKEDYFLKGESWENYVTALNDKAYLYHALDSLDQLKNVVFKNFAIANKYLKNDHAQWLRAKEQINSYYYSIGDYKSALDIINEVIPIKEKLNVNKREISTSYLNLGTAYIHLRDTEKALGSFKKSIKVLYPEGKLGLSSGEMLINIARVYKLKGELDSALYYLDITEGLLDTINMGGRFKKRKVEAYFLFIDTWLAKKDLGKSKEYLDRVGKIKLSNKEKIILQERLAKYYHEIGDYTKSKSAINKANELAEATKSRYSPPLRSRRNIDNANTLIKNNEVESALVVLQNGLKILAPKFADDNIYANPKSDQLLDKPDALKILHKKGKTLKGKYKETGDYKWLMSSFNTYLVACDVIRDVRQGIRSADSKNDLSENAISVYEEAIALAYEMFKKSGDESFITTAFKLAESNKAQLLLENLNEQEALGYAGIPDSLSRKDKDLRLYLATLEDRAIRKGSNNLNDELIFKTKQELDRFAAFLEKSYPRYYKLKYDNEPIDPVDIQKELLDKNTALIEYFVGIENIYLFIISTEQLGMQLIQKDSLAIKEIKNLRNLLKVRPGNEDPEQEFKDFTYSARTVYNSFVREAFESLPEAIYTLIIIPDDQINYIPFEVLLSEDSKGEKSYSLETLSYLFEDYAINYNYSATLLSKVKLKEVADFKDDFIGYAPTFDKSTSTNARPAHFSGLTNLRCNKEEVESIASVIGGEKRMNGAATKADFLREAKDYKIIHLATHAFVNQNDSKLNRIYLQDDFLSDVNLYSLALNTELAVLSACNTGSGELLRGEGVMNLARGFINAGCSSTIMSMWSVDDCTTAELMLLFYKELKNGLKKDEALRQSKIKYLTTANKTKMHPYYWAAFVPFGDMQAMEFRSSWLPSTQSLILFGGVIILAGFLYFRKK
jgi:CHAT domain-containing protein